MATARVVPLLPNNGVSAEAPLTAELGGGLVTIGLEQETKDLLENFVPVAEGVNEQAAIALAAAEAAAASEVVAEGAAERAEGAADVINISKPSWAELVLVVPTSLKQSATVSVNDAGTHTGRTAASPNTNVAGVPNAGVYGAYGLGVGQWRRDGDVSPTGLASPAQTITGTATNLGVTPQGDKAALDSRVGPLEIAVPALDARATSLEDKIRSGLPFAPEGVEMAFSAELDGGKQAPVVGVDGRHYQTLADGSLDRVPSTVDLADAIEPFAGLVGTEVPLPMLIGGERPYVVETDGDNRVVYAETLEGSTFGPGPSGLVRVLREGDVATTTTPSYVYDATTRISVPATLDRMVGILFRGQSNQLAVNDSTDALLASTALYPTKALMLGSSPRLTGSAQTAFSPLVEVLTDSGSRESSCSSTINHIIKAIEDAGLVSPVFVAMNDARGATPIEGLKRGSASWTAMLVGVANATALAKAQGRGFYVPFVDFVGNESNSDAGVSADYYTAALIQMQRQLEEDIRAITTQWEPVVVCLTAIAMAMRSSQGFDSFHQPIFEAYNRLRTHPRFVISGPTYQYPRDAAVRLDGLHMNSLAQNRSGIPKSRAALSVLFGTGYHDLYPMAHRWLSTTQFAVQFAVPGSIEGGLPVLDLSEAEVAINDNVGTGAKAIAGTLGFVFADGTGSPPAITTIAVSAAASGWAAREVIFTLATAPAGDCKLSYALTKSPGFVAASNGSGPLFGPRGVLRGNIGIQSLYEPGYVSYPWATPFILNLGRA